MVTLNPKSVEILGSTARRIRELIDLVPEDKSSFMESRSIQDQVTLRWILAVTGCLRLAVELVKSHQLEQGAGLGDFFDCLCEADILSDDLADALQDMTVLRNQLLFDYDSVPIPSVHTTALASSEVMVDYLACIAALPETDDRATESS